MEKAFRPSILLTWAFFILVLISVAALLGPVLADSKQPFTDVPALSIVSLFLPVILSIRPFMDKRCLENQTLYAITNYRIIAVVKDEPMYLTIGKGMQVGVDQQEDGCGNLRFGDTVGKPCGEEPRPRRVGDLGRGPQERYAGASLLPRGSAQRTASLPRLTAGFLLTFPGVPLERSLAELVFLSPGRPQ